MVFAEERRVNSETCVVLIFPQCSCLPMPPTPYPHCVNLRDVPLPFQGREFSHCIDDPTLSFPYFFYTCKSILILDQLNDSL